MVAPQPAGDGEPKPGGESKTMLVMPRVESSVTRGDQMALVSGTPWTKTLVLWGIGRIYTCWELRNVAIRLSSEPSHAAILPHKSAVFVCLRSG